MTQVAETITLFKRLREIKLGRDILLLRLPISHGCKRSKESVSPWAQCDFTLQSDGENSVIAHADRLLRKVMREQHPDVGLIDAFTWTVAPNGVGRHSCVPSDHISAHLGSSVARMAALQQVLHGVRLMGCDKPAWASNLAASVSGVADEDVEAVNSVPSFDDEALNVLGCAQIVPGVRYTGSKCA